MMIMTTKMASADHNDCFNEDDCGEADTDNDAAAAVTADDDEDLMFTVGAVSCLL